MVKIVLRRKKDGTSAIIKDGKYAGTKARDEGKEAPVPANNVDASPSLPAHPSEAGEGLEGIYKTFQKAQESANGEPTEGDTSTDPKDNWGIATVYDDHGNEFHTPVFPATAAGVQEDPSLRGLKTRLEKALGEMNDRSMHIIGQPIFEQTQPPLPGGAPYPLEVIMKELMDPSGSWDAAEERLLEVMVKYDSAPNREEKNAWAEAGKAMQTASKMIMYRESKKLEAVGQDTSSLYRDKEEQDYYEATYPASDKNFINFLSGVPYSEWEPYPED